MKAIPKKKVRYTLDELLSRGRKSDLTVSRNERGLEQARLGSF